jgi:hypothetical protein
MNIPDPQHCLPYLVHFFRRLYWNLPPPLVQRCSVLLPGWVIWKYLNYPCKFFSLGSWLVSVQSTPNGEEGDNSSTDLNPNTSSSIQLQCIQDASPHLADKTTSKPNRNVVCINLLINLHNVPTYQTNIQKDWH